MRKFLLAFAAGLAFGALADVGGMQAGGMQAVPVAVCTSCQGAGTSSFTCNPCKGTGRQNGFKCTYCNGRGFSKCFACNGTGQK